MAISELKVIDQTLAGKLISEIILQFEKSRVTLKDIISSRVEMEVQKYNEKSTEYFNGLVQPTEAEETLNGYRMRKRKTIDAETQTYIALKAFKSNGYFVFVDDRQIESLDEEVEIAPHTKVCFVKMVPLVGG
jgi:hypothetical protein